MWSRQPQSPIKGKEEIYNPAHSDGLHWNQWFGRSAFSKEGWPRWDRGRAVWRWTQNTKNDIQRQGKHLHILLEIWQCNWWLSLEICGIPSDAQGKEASHWQYVHNLNSSLQFIYLSLYSKPTPKKGRRIETEEEQSDSELEIPNTKSKGKVSNYVSYLNDGSALTIWHRSEWNLLLPKQRSPHFMLCM